MRALKADRVALPACRAPGRTKLSMIAICTPAAHWKLIAGQAKAAGYGYIYVTDEGCDVNHAYDGLPVTWTAQTTMF